MEHDASPGINSRWGISDSLSLGLDVYENIQLRNCFVWACGGIDPKTFRKWVWPFIRALAELEYTVVSFYVCIIYIVLLLILTNLVYIF